MKNLISGVWWKAAGSRALRTALALAVPYLPTIVYDNTWLFVASTAGFGAVVSLLTSLRGISETTDKVVPWYYSIFERGIKTTAQALIAAAGTATLFEAVTWTEVPAIVGTSLLVTLTAAVLGKLPGTDEPVAAKTVTISNYNIEQGKTVQEEVPVVAAVAAEVTPAADTSLSNDGHGK